MEIYEGGSMEGLSLPVDSRKGPNCGITSVAICAGATFQEAWDICSEGKRSNYRGRTTTSDRMKAFSELGIDFEEIEFPKQTLWRFIRDYTDPDTIYSVTITGHVVTVLNGYVIDQNGAWDIKNCPHKSCRAWHALKIIR